jgi:hypothetical protein
MAISPAAAKQAAERGLQNFDRVGNPDLVAAYAAGQAGVPLLVKRLDKTGGDYYLVPWEDARGIALVVQIDASSGEMSSAAVMPAPSSRLVIDPGDARDIVETRLKLRVIGEPKAVWRPSRESASPLQPLCHVPVQEGDVFVSLDGSTYRSLTPFGKGG